MARTLGPLGPTPSLSGPPDRRSQCKEFLHRLEQFTQGQVKQMFYKANENDIPILTKKINEKVKDVKFRFNSSFSADPEKLSDEVNDFLRLLLVEYGEIGIKEIFDKIKKIYNLLEYDTNRRDDFAIVEQIRQEYIDTKKIAKSTMLYLNKLNRELKVKKEDDNVQRTQQQQQPNYKSTQIW